MSHKRIELIAVSDSSTKEILRIFNEVFEKAEERNISIVLKEFNVINVDC